jgi:hypothetical protein
MNKGGSRSIYKNRKKNSLFQITDKHVMRDINKFDLNPGFSNENCNHLNIGPGAYKPKYNWSVKGTKIMPDVSKSLIRKSRKK